MSDKGREVVMFWYLEAIEMPHKPHGGLFSARTLHSMHNLFTCPPDPPGRMAFLLSGVMHCSRKLVAAPFIRTCQKTTS